MNKSRCLTLITALLFSTGFVSAASMSRSFPQVNTSPEEPALSVILDKCFGLDMERDLRNPRIQGSMPAALFQRANPNRPVRFRPLVALGMSDRTHGGWYCGGMHADNVSETRNIKKHESWNFAWKQSEDERKTLNFTAPPLDDEEITFDPGPLPFGLWISNEHFTTGSTVFTEPCLVQKHNQRLADQPYKVMIYPCTDRQNGGVIPNSYLLAWEYSTNDDFQDVITRIDNVRLLPAEPCLPGLLSEDAYVQQLANGFWFIEGPTWNANHKELYFSDIMRSQVLSYRGETTASVTEHSGNSNGLMFDKQGRLVACEGAGTGGHRRVARYDLRGDVDVLADEYQGKPLNSPNDLWLDQHGGLYFTDPRYGPRDTMAMEVEGVYYVSRDGQIKRVIDNLVRPNGLAISPDGNWLYVVDNAADLLYRYPIEGPGQLGEGQTLLHVTFPDGMTVDKDGRLYITCHEGIYVVNKEGCYLGLIRFPQQPANCTFGGPNYQTLFVTARSGLYAIDTLTRGWHIHLDGSKP